MTNISTPMNYAYYPQPALLLQSQSYEIPIPAALRKLLLAVWLGNVALGLLFIYIFKLKLIGAIIIIFPTFIGMVLEPVFALSMMMMSITTGAGIGFAQIFSLDRGVGIALAVAFFINYLITRRPLQLRSKIFWLLGVYTVYNAMDAFFVPFTNLEIIRAFTQVQLYILFVIVYIILVSRKWSAFHWTLRAYVVAMIGVIFLSLLTGAEMKSEEVRGLGGRYAATLGSAIDANHLASLVSLALITALYLFIKDKKLIWRGIYTLVLITCSVMLFKIGSRGAFIALAAALGLPLIFIRQVVKNAGIILLAIIGFGLMAGAGYFVFKKGMVAKKVQSRLTDIEHARTSIKTRWAYAKGAIRSAARYPLGTGYYAWPMRTGLDHLPHNDFFFLLGVYGLPSAMLYIAFVLYLIYVVFKMPNSLEKIYLRAILTFILVMGLSLTIVMKKFYWIFIAYIIAGSELLKEQALMYYYYYRR